MARSAPKGKLVAQNRRARHNYIIEETLEAGVVLTGSEVKSLRAGRVSLNEAWAGSQRGELYLMNCHVPVYKEAGDLNHLPTPAAQAAGSSARAEPAHRCRAAGRPHARAVAHLLQRTRRRQGGTGGRPWEAQIG